MKREEKLEMQLRANEMTGGLPELTAMVWDGNASLCISLVCNGGNLSAGLFQKFLVLRSELVKENPKR